MKLTVSTVLTALALVSATQAAVLPPADRHMVDRRNNGNADSLLQGFAAGLHSVVGSWNQHQSSSSGSSHTRNAAVSNSTASTQSGSNSSGSGSSTGSSTGSSSSSASPSSSSSSSSSNSGNTPLSNSGKLGLAWANKGSMNINRWINDKVSWYYSWDATPGWRNAPTNITFCPMLWGERNEDDFRQHVLQNLNGKHNQGKCVLGMNEPNQKGQSDMSVNTACGLMRANILPLKGLGWYVVSPVTTNAPSGETWMDNFRSTCPDVWSAIDAVALHYYDTSTNKFKKYVNHWHNKYEKPIWVTEYACQNFNGGAQCSTGQAYNFHTEMANWFNEQDFVEAYAPFGVMQNMQGVSSTNQLANGQTPSPLFNAITQ